GGGPAVGRLRTAGDLCGRRGAERGLRPRHCRLDAAADGAQPLGATADLRAGDVRLGSRPESSSRSDRTDDVTQEGPVPLVARADLAGAGVSRRRRRVDGRVQRHLRRRRDLPADACPVLAGAARRAEPADRFVTAIAVFLCATLFLGELGDFYERYWWWDVVLHGGSAVAFGLVGALLMLMLVQGSQLRAAPLTVAFFAF